MAVENLILGSQWVDAERSDVEIWFCDDIGVCVWKMTLL